MFESVFALVAETGGVFKVPPVPDEATDPEKVLRRVPRRNNMDRDRMSKSILSSHAATSPARWEPKFPFDLVVAYEDTQTRNRALHLYDHLAQQLLDDYDFQCSWWRFDLLSDPTLYQKSTDMSADANMVILSLHARKELTPLQKTWLDSWLPRRDGRKSALVSIIAGTEEAVQESEPMVVSLRRAARLARMDFFQSQLRAAIAFAGAHPGAFALACGRGSRDS
jgi:hypothetical protein